MRNRLPKLKRFFTPKELEKEEKPVYKKLKWDMTIYHPTIKDFGETIYLIKSGVLCVTNNNEFKIHGTLVSSDKIQKFLENKIGSQLKPVGLADGPVFVAQNGKLYCYQSTDTYITKPGDDEHMPSFSTVFYEVIIYNPEKVKYLDYQVRWSGSKTPPVELIIENGKKIPILRGTEAIKFASVEMIESAIEDLQDILNSSGIDTIMGNIRDKFNGSKMWVVIEEAEADIRNLKETIHGQEASQVQVSTDTTPRV